MINREKGWIKAITKAHIPYRFIFFDTETHTTSLDKLHQKLTFRLGVAIYIHFDKNLNIIEREVFKFYSADDFIEFCLSKATHKEKVCIFAHNIGFDIRILDLPHLFDERQIKTELPIMNERIFIWKIDHKGYKLEFLDTANYGVISVKMLGETLGFDKLSVDFNNVTDEQLFIYCQRDVEIIEKFVIHFITFVFKNKLGKLQPTLASQAFTAWRYRFLTQSCFIHTHEETLQLERDSYHGGRVECFFIGEKTDENYYYLDINSMYPHIMRTSLLPVRLRSYQSDIPLNYIKSRLINSYCIADVTLKTSDNAYALLHNNKLIFPTGEFRTVLHHSELEYAFRHNHLRKIHRIATYDKALMFREYVDFFYNERLKAASNGDEVWKYIAKIFMNSLYGKFGQSGFKREEIDNTGEISYWRVTNKNLDTGEYTQEFAWQGRIYVESRSGESYFSSPAIAGAITANARMLLFSIIKKAGLDNVFYCDTDSVIVNQSGYDKLQDMINKSELGKLKLEDSNTLLKIYGNKDYQFGDKVRVKGVSGNAKEIIKGLWEYIEFPSFKSWINKGLSEDMILTTRIKRRKSSYNKGVLLSSGKVRPFIFPDESNL